MGRKVLLSLLCLLAPVLGAASVRGENYAFLVAVQDYNVKSLRPLKFTRNDIFAFKNVLQGSDFKLDNIVVMSDKPREIRYAAESDKIRKQLDTLLAGLQESDTLVVAFAGHGVQFEGDPKNYFCPLDADLEDPKHSRLIAIGEIYEKLQNCPARRKLLVVDACRKDPLAALARSRDTIKLKSLTRPQSEAVPKGVVALFSCAAGQEAFEWPEFQHGIFFHHLIEGWSGAGTSGGKQVTLDEAITYARQKTQVFARKQLDVPQTPQLKSDFEGTWVLRKLEVENSIGMTLRLIPPGEFQMGNEVTVDDLLREFPRTNRELAEECSPRHSVRITKAFMLGKYEVTRGQFRKFVTATGYKTERERNGQGGWGFDPAANKFDGPNLKYSWRSFGFEQTDEHPVVNITWNDAVKFCEWLSQKEQRLYRLPTEAEWEYACRAGTTTRFQGGNAKESLTEFGNTADESVHEKFPDWPAMRVRDGYVFTAPVGKFQPNKFGLYDMHGNAWEMCSDWHDPKYYANSPHFDPQGPQQGTEKICRGGSWRRPASLARSAARGRNPPSEARLSVGFRVARGRLAN